MANYRNSDAWKRAIELTLEIYRVTVRFPDEELFGLTAQVRRAGIVAASKVAEGELEEARRALIEIETQIIIAARLDYLQKPAARRLYKLARAAVKALDAVTTEAIAPQPRAPVRPPVPASASDPPRTTPR